MNGRPRSLLSFYMSNYGSPAQSQQERQAQITLNTILKHHGIANQTYRTPYTVSWERTPNPRWAPGRGGWLRRCRRRSRTTEAWGREEWRGSSNGEQTKKRKASTFLAGKDRGSRMGGRDGGAPTSTWFEKPWQWRRRGTSWWWLPSLLPSLPGLGRLLRVVADAMFELVWEHIDKGVFVIQTGNNDV